MNRTLKIILAGWGIAFGLAVLGLIASLPFLGAEKALWVLEPIPLTILFVIGLLVAARWLK